MYIPSADILTTKNNFSFIQKRISECQFLLSGRYHHLIFAANTGTQICPFSSSSHKIEGLSELLSSYEKPISVFDPTDIHFHKKSILNYIHSILNQSPPWNQDELKTKFVNSLNNIINEIK